MSPKDFEEKLYNFFIKASENTIFQDTIELVSGNKFPDIVINQFYGIEVKTTKKDQWTSVGNSILEQTRVQNVGCIYIYFAKLSGDIDFKYRLYEECLYDIGVTHSPRYLINMNISKEETIFTKMNIEYEVFRNHKKPIDVLRQYLRNSSKSASEPWWLGDGEEEKYIVSPTVKLFKYLSQEKKRDIRYQALALFPQLFGNSQNKYSNVATWLAARYGVVNPNLRDVFSAGGRVTLYIENKSFTNLPKIFEHLYDGRQKIKNVINSTSKKDLEYYWQIKNINDRLSCWKKLLLDYCSLDRSQVEFLDLFLRKFF